MTTIHVTGDTGVLGRATVPMLLIACYQVRALSRSTSNYAGIRATGAEVVRGSLFDSDALATTMEGAETALHLATTIPWGSDVRRRKAWRENDGMRAEEMRIVRSKRRAIE